MGRTEAVDLPFGHDNLAQGYTLQPLIPFPDSRLSPEQTRAHLQQVGFKWRSNTYRCARPGTSAGGYYSTVDDLLKLARALQTNRLLSEEAMAEMRKSHSTDNPNYGLGFTTRGGHIGHSGSAPGTDARFRIYSGRPHHHRSRQS